MVDSTLFHYDVANKHGIYNTAKHSGAVAQGMVKFSSWPLYSVQMHGRIKKAAQNGNWKPFLTAAGALAFGAAYHYFYHDKMKKDRISKKLDKFFYKRAPGQQLVDPIVSLVKNPGRMVESSLDLNLSLLEYTWDGKLPKRTKRMFDSLYKVAKPEEAEAFYEKTVDITKEGIRDLVKALRDKGATEDADNLEYWVNEF